MTISTFFFLFFIAVIINIIIIILLLLHGSEEFIHRSLWSRTKLKTGSRHTSAHPWALFLSPLLCVVFGERQILQHASRVLRSSSLTLPPRRTECYGTSGSRVLPCNSLVTWALPLSSPTTLAKRKIGVKSEKNIFDFSCHPTRKPK